VNFDFENKDLRDLYVTGGGKLATAFPPQVVDEFFVAMAEITAAPDEQDLRKLKSRRFEKLKARGGEHSIRLNGQFRLIFVKEMAEDGPKLMIRKLEDYH
jgi:plasmid maintenance system killer protein